MTSRENGGLKLSFGVGAMDSEGWLHCDLNTVARHMNFFLTVEMFSFIPTHELELEFFEFYTEDQELNILLLCPSHGELLN